MLLCAVVNKEINMIISVQQKSATKCEVVKRNVRDTAAGIKRVTASIKSNSSWIVVGNSCYVIAAG